MGKDTGRPTKYKKEYAEQARKICKLGATDLQLADIFGVAESTIYKWKLDHKEFSEAVSGGKQNPDENVKMALYQSAIGYSHQDTHISNFQGKITRTETTRHYPPNFNSMQLWLLNRLPEDWRNKQEFTVSIDETKYEALQKLYEEKLKDES